MRGVAKPNEAIVEFSMRQMLDVLAPSNFAATNPEVLQKAFQTGGENFVAGWLAELVQRLDAPVVGRSAGGRPR